MMARVLRAVCASEENLYHCLSKECRSKSLITNIKADQSSLGAHCLALRLIKDLQSCGLFFV